MIADKFIGNYIGAVKSAIEANREALASGVHTDLYQVGRLQGNIAGLRMALELLENDLENADQ